MSSSPIGTLILEAERLGKKSARGNYTAGAKCGCEVLVMWFSENSRSNDIQRCSEHALPISR